MTTIKTKAISNVNVFDGKNVIGIKTVVFSDGVITSILNELPKDISEVIDGSGCTLLPGLIDAHVHTSVEFLKDALKFGITTELEMMGGFTSKGRETQLKGVTGAADVRSAGMGLTAPGGHPDELIPKGDGIPEFVLKEMEKMSEEEKAIFLAAHQAQKEEEEIGADVTSISGAIDFVHRQVNNGADYFKIMIEEGTVMNAPGLPVIETPVLKAAVDEAHKLDKIAIAHVLTAEAAKTAVEIGVDGLAHLFIDRPDWTKGLIEAIAAKGIFVTPCLVLNSSIIGNSACHVAHDERVEKKLNEDWKMTMCSCFNTFPEGNMKDNFDNVRDLRDAGVDILVGTDVSVPMPHLGGLAHGVSVHHEMQLLVEAGLSPIEALRAATSVPSKRFNLLDRGSIAEGLRADLLLVKGDPTINISDSLSIVGIWKEGESYHS
ncbi:amidohydrolase family protein [Flavobacterium sp. S87F.05.LMB.W.Kidney.N]|uniref:amidohydrolase family protein n=1 Tax=Flavobacterium sp. S87F.05.LMB.W.Kidney.N TaxID=1278758 RepID=UPI00106715BD|nr:amidohydrolase family protein [Flavobacterium sp. S87F.05.LMB.W.Kidney.N]TDX10470.1 imidazolonepropionase-like amidohydrolase [Flavobacterium sp. S87F.05.LMB.W.Kidney.N]